ncbi:MAG TPA: carbohydrate kinase [Thiotrichales bacterium]|nr:carbohydrate kinase [Thiotrichales bacterium]
MDAPPSRLPPLTVTAPLYLGIDFGTSGCRALAIDGEGQVAAEARVPMPPPHREGGGESRQDPLLWWEALESVTARLWEEIPAKRVAAVAIDGTSATLVVTDGEGKPLTEAWMYDDASATEATRRVTSVIPAASAAHGPTSSLAKLLSLLPCHPGIRHALHQAEWITARLTGDLRLRDENNALKMGYDIVERRWPDWLLELEVTEEVLGQVRPPGTPAGRASTDAAARLGFDPATRVACGTTDSTAGFLATGAVGLGEAVTSLGSTLVLKMISDRPLFHPPSGIYSHRLGDRWLVGGASNAGGAVLERFFSAEEMARLSERIDPAQPSGLDYYPLLRPGERFPHADPRLQPRLEPRPAEPERFLHGLLEGLARIEAEGYARLEALGAPRLRSVRTVGGGASNRTWRAIRQRLLGVPFREPRHTEAAYGAALLARGLAG